MGIDRLGADVVACRFAIGSWRSSDWRQWMEIKNQFQVPLPPDQAWSVLMDIPRIAPCMPGAELIEQVDGRTYKGKVSVRLGPVALAFTGTARFEELNEAARHARVRAQGTDTKGRGAAAAAIDFQLMAEAGGTQVQVITDVNLSGSVAQYGRASGIIQSVANQLMAQFADNLRRSIDVPSTRIPDEPAAVAAQQPVPQTAPISGFGLILRALIASIKQRFKR
jgi:uncharacterized protein